MRTAIPLSVSKPRYPRVDVMRFSIFIVKFFIIGALFIVSNESLYLSEGEDLSKFFDLFSVWMSGLFSQVQEITGYVVDSEWLPQNNSPLPETVG